jgi:hypothetical protein
MRNFNVELRYFSDEKYETSDIFDLKGNRIYPRLSRFLGMMRLDSILGYIDEIST